ncbi:pentapeptide repeat-containing protein [Roseivirga sp. BDSF3-8]|uniref:pentapeptide repeat-containing protein n=1 Tax=Roseivirga sp. BDSF3-8 TaxID=3241598 RepID=UPI0035319D83
MVRLSEARLSEARLSEARLSEARLSEARLSEARLSVVRLSVVRHCRMFFQAVFLKRQCLPTPAPIVCDPNPRRGIGWG